MTERKAIIIGGSSGIGLEIAKGLIKQGCMVYIVGRNRERLDQASKAIGPLAVGVQGDVSTRNGQDELIERLKSLLKSESLDFLIHSAAEYHIADCLDETPDRLMETFQANVFSAVYLSRVFYPMLLKGIGKSVLFLSSTLSVKPVPGTGAYAASKAALDSFVASLALEWAPKGIRVNSLLPGVVDTPIHEPKSKDDPPKKEKLEALSKFHPLGRVGGAEEVARAALFLLDPQSSWITGVKWNIDGGISLV